nr:uncharacterized protein LOC113802123 [Penaeus vannamei]
MTTLESADAAALKDLLPQDVQTLVQDSDSHLLGSGSCASVYAVSCEGRTEESHALLMSFCGKEALRVYLRRGGLSFQHALSGALCVTERLQDLHRAGFVHGDLKLNNVTLKEDGERNVESVHLVDFGLSARVGERFPPRKRPRNMAWYCGCRYAGRPLVPPCDLPGLATILARLFRGRDDVPPKHDQRPALEDVRRCLAEACASLPPEEEGRKAQLEACASLPPEEEGRKAQPEAAPAGKRPREDEDEPQERTTPAEEQVAQGPERKRARADPEQVALGSAHCRHAQ